MRLRYLLIVLVAFRMFVPMRYVVCILRFSRLCFYIFVRIFFGSLTFVASLIVFRATWFMRFFVLLSIVACTLLYRTFNLSLFVSVTLEFAPVCCCGGDFAIWRVFGICGFNFVSCLLMNTSFFDHRCKSCNLSAGSGGFVRFFLSNQACFVLSQFRLLGELVVASFERGVFGFRPM